MAYTPRRTHRASIPKIYKYAFRFQVFDEPVRGTIEPHGDVDVPAECGRERVEHGQVIGGRAGRIQPEEEIDVG